jgi:hypothetical protein
VLANAFCITCESSELDKFSILIAGYKACKSNNLLLSLLDPVICIELFIVEGGDFKRRFMDEKHSLFDWN